MAVESNQHHELSGSSCRRCHSHKIKCSGGTPCHNCAQQPKGSVECTYPMRDRKILIQERFQSSWPPTSSQITDRADLHALPATLISYDKRTKPYGWAVACQRKMQVKQNLRARSQKKNPTPMRRMATIMEQVMQMLSFEIHSSKIVRGLLPTTPLVNLSTLERQRARHSVRG